MNKTRLFKRNAQGKIITWEIEDIGNETVALTYGLLEGELHKETFRSKSTAEKEIKSRVLAKRKNGYLTISDLRDNAPTFISDSYIMTAYLETYLPKDNLTLDKDKFCMLAKTLEDNKPFEKHTYDGQWKINGERCIIHLEKSEDLFNPYKCRYTSRHGNDWTNKLFWMDEIIIPALREELKELMIEEDVALDGELYLPGYTINEINHFIKDTTCIQHKALQFWCYDLCIESMPAETRHEYLKTNLSVDSPWFGSKEAHLNNKIQFLLLPSVVINNINEAINARNSYIDLGFEGLIIRDVDAEYQFGKRNLSMLKFKKIYDGYFEIVDIQPQDRKSNLPLFTLKNDINSATFECTINTTHSEQEKYLVFKDKYIGKKGFVEYRERSGVKEVPFHAKLIKIL